jgi:hypothetical protein
MTDTVAAAMRSVAADWEAECVRRRRISKVDAVADAIAWCAGELLDRLQEVDGPGAMRTVDQYSRDHAVTPQTVCRWIRRGELDALRTPHGWRIARAAVRRRKRGPRAAPQNREAL